MDKECLGVGMEIKKVLQDIQQKNWLTEEAPGHLGLCLYFMDSFARWHEYVPFPYLSLSMLLFEKGIMREETLPEEKNKLFLWIIEQAKKDRMYPANLLKKQRAIEKKLNLLFKRIDSIGLESAKNSEILELYRRMYEIYVPFVVMAGFPEIGDGFAEHHTRPMLREKEKIRENELNEVMVMFSTPIMSSFMDEEHIDFLMLCLDHLKGNKKAFEDRMKEHVQKYFWIRNNYAETYYLDEGYFMKRVKEETKGKTEKDILKEIASIKKQKEDFRKKKVLFRKKYRLSHDSAVMFKLYETFGIMIDERKRTMLRANHYIAKLLKESGARYGLDWSDVGHYTSQEVEDLLSDGKIVPKDDIKRRFECSVYITKPGEKRLVVGEDARKIIEAFNSKISKDSVKGMVANKANGNLTGEVSVIINPHKDHFEEGKILVTTMTRPDFIHLIKKAKAIITDEGGITCHAAIVSREFGIPCIIGTKNGTRMLKTGDKVEIDTEKGVVRKIA